jgi:mRNA interferase ChpB
MDRGDIYFVTLDPTQGHEQQGHRPVFIVSPAAFNRMTQTPIVLPITNGGGFARTRGFAVALPLGALRTTGVVRCDQPRAIDMNARRGRYVEQVPATVTAHVLAKLATLVQ